MGDRLPCLNENRAVLEYHRLEVGEKRSIVGAGEGEQESIALRARWCSGWIHGGLSSVVVGHLTAEGTARTAGLGVERWVSTRRDHRAAVVSVVCF